MSSKGLRLEIFPISRLSHELRFQIWDNVGGSLLELGGGYTMSRFVIRRLRQPDDFAAVATLVNMIWSEPTTAELLKEVEDKIPPGELHYNDEGELMGWDRPQWVAEDEHGQVMAYAIAWRAPWTENGALNHTIVVH